MDEVELQKEWEKIVSEWLKAMLDIFQGDKIVIVELTQRKDNSNG